MKPVEYRFNAVQNNTSLKPNDILGILTSGFNAVQNNTSLKLSAMQSFGVPCFNAVQNNTSLKPMNFNCAISDGF